MVRQTKIEAGDLSPVLRLRPAAGAGFNPHCVHTLCHTNKKNFSLPRRATSTQSLSKKQKQQALNLSANIKANKTNLRLNKHDTSYLSANPQLSSLVVS